MRWMWLALWVCVGCHAGQARLQQAGTNALVDRGELGVDPVTGAVLLVDNLTRASQNKSQRRWLVGAIPGSDEVVGILPLRNASDVRVVFSSRGPVVFFAGKGGQHVVRLDPSTLQPSESVVLDSDLHGLRVSPSRRWVVGSDNTSSDTDLWMFDLETFELSTVAWQAEGIEAQWLDGDRLVVVLTHRPEGEPTAVQVMVWDVRGPTADALASTTFELGVGGANGTIGLGDFLSWPTVSPDGETLAVPLRVGASVQHKLAPVDVVVWHMPTGRTGRIPNLRGPVAFSDDSKSFVAYQLTGEGFAIQHELVVVRIEDLATRRTRVPWKLNPVPFTPGASTFWLRGSGMGPSYTLAPNADWALVANNAGSERLRHLDLRDGTWTTLPTPRASFNLGRAAVAQERLWVSARGQLFAVDGNAVQAQEVTLPRRVGGLAATADGEHLWVASRNQRCLFKVQASSGHVVEAVSVRDVDPRCAVP